MLVWEEVALRLAPIGLGLVASLWDSLVYNRERLWRWRGAVAACRLNVEEVSSTMTLRLRLMARAGPVQVWLEYVGGGKGTQVRVMVPGPPGFVGVRLRREIHKPSGAREIEIGDDSFDQTFFIEGPARLVTTLLDGEMRRLLAEADALGELEIGAGEIHAAVPDVKVPDLLPILLAIGRRLTENLDVASRLSENARQDTQVGVRLRNLLLLLREFPDKPITAETLRAACTDPAPQIRLRAALVLRDEGREVLAALADDLADDACSAQAVSTLGRQLPVERTKAILLRALRQRRLQTARTCLDALGRSRGAALGELAKVMAREKGELAVAAAQALGTTGEAAAEPALLQALERDLADLRLAAATALGHVGSAAAVQPLKEAAERWPRDKALLRATRQAIAEIQARIQGASPGQLSLAGAEAGQLSLAPAEAGQLSLATHPAGQLSFPPEGPAT